jgi:aldose 1-epimerase
MDLLRLRAGRLAVDLAPHAGGSIVRFAVEERDRAPVDLFRPTDIAMLTPGRANDSACYPLVPFSNRIADGRLIVEGRDIYLRPNAAGFRHPIHGDGWQRPWLVERSNETDVDLLYVHDRQGWPFPYRARQSFRLTEDALTVGISVQSTDPSPVPAGIGLHPFFVRDDDTTLVCRPQRVWLADAESLPTTRVDIPPRWDFSTPRKISGVALDNCFDGWDGHAVITWPSRRFSLEIEASPVFRHLVLYVPDGKSYFCVEPASHANNGFALHALGVEDVGYRLLANGDRLAGEVAFRVSNS